MSSVTHDPDKHFAEELRLNLQIMANRDFNTDPLTASEMLVTIPREKFYRMCQLSLDALQQRYKHPNEPRTENGTGAHANQNPLDCVTITLHKEGCALMQGDHTKACDCSTKP